MFYISKTVVPGDFCMKIVCNRSGVYLAQASSVVKYIIRDGRAVYAKRIDFFDVVKSVVAAESSIMVVFNGCIRQLDENLDEKNMHVFGRSNIDYKNPGSYVAYTKRGICIVSFFGQMVLYRTGEGLLSEPMEYSMGRCATVVLDFKAIDGRDRYASLEKNCNGTAVRVYEYDCVSRAIKMVAEQMVDDSGYMIVPLNSMMFVVFSSVSVFAFRSTFKVEKYDILELLRSSGVSGAGADIPMDGVFTCSAVSPEGMNELAVVVNADGLVFEIKATDCIELHYAAKVCVPKDVVIDYYGHFICLAHDSISQVYFVKRDEGSISIVYADDISSSMICRSAYVVHDELHHVYVCNGRNVGEVVEALPINFVCKAKITEDSNHEENVGEGSDDGAIKDVFASGDMICVCYGNRICNIKMNKTQFEKQYELECASEVLGYFRIQSHDVYVMRESIMVCDLIMDNQNTRGPEAYVKEVIHEYFCGSSRYVIFANHSRILLFEGSVMECIETGVVVRGLEVHDKYLFVVTGRRVIRVYSISERRFVFIQLLLEDFEFVMAFEGYLYVVGCAMHRFKINMDGSLGLPSWMNFNGKGIGRKGRIMILENDSMDVRCQRMIGVDGIRSVFVDGRVVVGEGMWLSIYDYDESRRIMIDGLVHADGACKILMNGMGYVENVNSRFSVKKFDGSIAFEGVGAAIEAASYGEYCVVAVNDCENSMNISDTRCFLNIYKQDILMYAFGIDYGPSVLRMEKSRIYCASLNAMYCYEIGLKTLLKKFRIEFPSKINCVCTDDARVFVGTEKDSVFVLKEGNVEHKDDVSRCIVSLEKFDKDRLIVGEMTGEVMIMNLFENCVAVTASIFVNDMPIMLIPGDRVFAVCLSGKVVEIQEIDKELFGFLQKLEDQIIAFSGKPFFEAFNKTRFVDAGYLKQVYDMSDEGMRDIYKSREFDIKRIFDVIGRL
ncbi:hypothetical protein HK407_08g13420 [Ordospora pajunii]|uniref:uncharacterized protein n=1 Tax=Ordospora pajunii TaxID=3039483 RepID=UPI0029526F4C|nr:uncharacterized protein HK407_08g13420 [Ordospora pajunii]KAH9411068.1 hypothetical protein HK407_08g13420 [Ordospora pajunii]